MIYCRFVKLTARMNRPIIGKLAFISLLFFYVVGCAPPLPDVFWPPSPAYPRIKFLRSFSNKRGLVGFSAAEALLGSDPIEGFGKPYGVHVDKNNVVYVTDTALGAVHVFDPNKKDFFVFGGILSKPIGITTDSRGRIFVTDTKLDKIVVFSPKGEYLTTVGEEGDFKQPVGIVLNEAMGRIYVVDTHRHHVAVHSLEDGKRLFTFGTRGKEEGQFNFPSQITMDPETNNLYVVDTMNGRIQVFDPEGRFMSAFGRLGDSPGGFARPKGIAFDTEGHLYVADAGLNTVQVFSKEGQILLVFAGAGYSRGKMNLAAGMAIDSEDKIYVVDQWDAKVNVYQFLSERYRREHPEEMEKILKERREKPGKLLKDY